MRRRTLRRTLAAALLATIPVTTTTTAQAAPRDASSDELIANAGDIVDGASYVITTTFKRPDGTRLVKAHAAAVGAPRLLRAQDGDAPADLSVLVDPVTGTDTLSVTIRKQAGAPATFPVAVLLRLDPPGTSLDVTHGYDATDATSAPAVFSTSTTFEIREETSKVGADVTTTGAQAPMSIAGGVAGTDHLGAKVDQLAQLAFPTTAPTELGIDASLTRSAASETVALDLAAPVALPADALVRDARGSASFTVTDLIRNLPTELHLRYQKTGTDHSATYQASSRIASSTVLVDEHVNGTKVRAVRVAATNLPLQFGAALTGPSSDRRASYSATEPVDSLTIGLDEFSSGVPVRMTEVKATDVPTRLSGRFTSVAPQSASVGSSSGTVGIVEVLHRTRSLQTGDKLGNGEEGVLVKDFPSGFVVHGRITRLRSATASWSNTLVSGGRSKTGSVTVRTDPTAPNRPFRARIDRQGETKAEFVSGVLNPLPDTLTVSFSQLQTTAQAIREQKASYSATETASTLALETNVGDRRFLRAVLPSGVPRSMSFCQGDRTSTCTTDPRVAVGQSMRLTAAGATTVKLFECERGPASGCSLSNAELFKDATLTLAGATATTPVLLDFDLDAPLIKGGDIGHLWIDSNDARVDGTLLIKDTSSDPCDDGAVSTADVRLVGVRAQNRFAELQVQNFGCSPTGVSIPSDSGTLRCGSGTRIDVNGPKPFGDLANDLCT